MSSSVSSFIRCVRQNHALEHATMHLLTHSSPSLRLMGRSDWTGFSIYGEVDTQVVLRAALEGLARLKHSERWLAVHPRCGTNLTVSALLSGGAVYAVTTLPIRSRLVRFTAALVALAAAVVVARPLGLVAQRHLTTSADLEGVRVKMVSREVWGNMVVHRVMVTCDNQAESYVLYPAR